MPSEKSVVVRPTAYFGRYTTGFHLYSISTDEAGEITAESLVTKGLSMDPYRFDTIGKAQEFALKEFNRNARFIPLVVEDTGDVKCPKCGYTKMAMVDKQVEHVVLENMPDDNGYADVGELIGETYRDEEWEPIIYCRNELCRESFNMKLEPLGHVPDSWVGFHYED